MLGSPATCAWIARLDHGAERRRLGARTNRLEDIPGKPGSLVLAAALLDWVQYGNDVISDPTLALDAPDGGRGAALTNLGHGLGAAEYLVQIADRAGIGIAAIGASDAGRIGHHRLQLLAYVGVGLAEQDGVAVAWTSCGHRCREALGQASVAVGLGEDLHALIFRHRPV